VLLAVEARSPEMEESFSGEMGRLGRPTSSQVLRIGRGKCMLLVSASEDVTRLMT
jgi:hypothetical protein